MRKLRSKEPKEVGEMTQLVKSLSQEHEDLQSHMKARFGGMRSAGKSERRKPLELIGHQPSQTGELGFRKRSCLKP